MMIYFHQMSDSDHMPDMEQKRPTWPTSKTEEYFILDDHKMPDFHQMPAKYQNVTQIQTCDI